MPMGEPYKRDLERSYHRFEQNGGTQFARQSSYGLLQGLLIDSLLGRNLERWLEIYELHRDAPPPTHSTIVVPQVYLLRALAAWLLNQPVEAIVNAGWDAVDTAWSDVGYDDEARRIVSSAALGLAHARGNQEEIAHWCRIRQYYAPTDAMTDVELLLGARALTAPDIIALVGKQNVSLFNESAANALAALSTQASTLGQPLASLLSEGTRRIDDDYWPAGAGPARANIEEVSWRLSEDSLDANLFISGRGGYLHNPAPLLEPLLAIAETLEQMLTDNMPESLEEELSNGDLRCALADPDVPLQVTLFISDSVHNELDIDSDTDLAPYRQRLATSVQWMQQRHDDDFAGGVELSCI